MDKEKKIKIIESKFTEKKVVQFTTILKRCDEIAWKQFIMNETKDIENDIIKFDLITLYIEVVKNFFKTIKKRWATNKNRTSEEIKKDLDNLKSYFNVLDWLEEEKEGDE
jgi:hypothetical protein